LGVVQRQLLAIDLDSEGFVFVDLPDLGDFDPVSHYLSSVLSNRKYAEQYSQYAAYYSAAVLGFSLNVATNRFFAIIMSTLKRMKRLFVAGPPQGKKCP